MGFRRVGDAHVCALTSKAWCLFAQDAVDRGKSMCYYDDDLALLRQQLARTQKKIRDCHSSVSAHIREFEDRRPVVISGTKYQGPSKPVDGKYVCTGRKSNGRLVFKCAETKFCLLSWEKEKWSPEKWVVSGSLQHYTWKRTVLAVKDSCALPYQTEVGSKWKEYNADVDTWLDNEDLQVRSHASRRFCC